MTASCCLILCAVVMAILLVAPVPNSFSADMVSVEVIDGTETGVGHNVFDDTIHFFCPGCVSLLPIGFFERFTNYNKESYTVTSIPFQYFHLWDRYFKPPKKRDSF